MMVFLRFWIIFRYFGVGVKRFWVCISGYIIFMRMFRKYELVRRLLVRILVVSRFRRKISLI